MNPPIPPGNPFPGLRPFESDENELFFGREKQVDELLRRIRSCRFLAVVGTSGSGKSSLVRCGLIPALQSGFMTTAGSSWRIATLRPGEDPVGHLAAALNARDVLGADEEMASTNRVLLEATLHRGTLGLVNAVRQARIPYDENVLVIVDQFEELFRFREGRNRESSRDEAVRFVKLLLEGARQSEALVYVVMTMRSDFIGKCVEFPGLPEAINHGQYLVPRLTRYELRSAITGPVAVSGAEITPRLVLRLLNEVGNDQDQLPVLQHALMRTWDHWQHHTQKGPIDIADYDAIGTMREALSLHAEEAYQETGSERAKQITALIFKALTDTFSDERGIRRPTSIGQLSAICEAPESDVIQIVEIFRRSGRSFLMPPAEAPLESRSIVDISHESLMRCWSRLITWAEEERASTRLYFRLSQASAWFEEGTAGLWHNPELELGVRWKRENHPTQAWAERYDSSFARAINFLDRSEKERDRVQAEREQERKRKLKLAWTVAGALATLLVIAAIALIDAALASKKSLRAEANLYQAVRTADQIMSTTGRLEGEGDLRLGKFQKDLLEKMSVFYTSIAQQEPKSEEIRRGAAWAYSRLGDINRLLGNYHEAIGKYKDAIGKFEQLDRDFPGKAEYREALGYAHNFSGEALRLWAEGREAAPQNGRSDSAKEYESAMRLQQALHEEQPQNRKYQQELARTRYNRGILHFDAGDLKSSEPDFRESIRLLEPLVETEGKLGPEEEGNPPSLDLARAYNNLSNLLATEGHLSDAQDFFQRAIRIQENLVQNDPNNWDYRQQLAIFHNNLAFLAWQRGDKEMARQQNHAALDSFEDLSTPSPLMETERARAHMLYHLLGASKPSEFNALYKHLGEEYVSLAKEYLQDGDPESAHLATQSLSRVLPEIAEPDRTRLEKSYRDLLEQLHGTAGSVK